ncbi:MAG TPA: transposase, partial [Beijerinckiaceae bacterium]|nr:transposase [Beijerinckiaceae bacterium]
MLTAGLSVRRINPNRLRQFARARGALAKNDRLDARLIAEYVATMPTHAMRHDPDAARIAEIVTMRRQLSDEHVAVENQAAQLEDAMLRRLAKRRLARIEADIRLLEKRLTELIAEYVATMPAHVVGHDPAAARIAEIVTMRRQLSDEHVAVENQAAQLEDAMLRRLAKRRLA